MFSEKVIEVVSLEISTIKRNRKIKKEKEKIQLVINIVFSCLLTMQYHNVKVVSATDYPPSSYSWGYKVLKQGHDFGND